MTKDGFSSLIPEGPDCAAAPVVGAVLRELIKNRGFDANETERHRLFGELSPTAPSLPELLAASADGQSITVSQLLIPGVDGNDESTTAAIETHLDGASAGASVWSVDDKFKADCDRNMKPEFNGLGFGSPPMESGRSIAPKERLRRAPLMLPLRLLADLELAKVAGCVVIGEIITELYVLPQARSLRIVVPS